MSSPFLFISFGNTVHTMLLAALFPGLPFEQVLLPVLVLVGIGLVASAVFVTITRRSVTTGRSRAWLSSLLYAAFLASAIVLATTTFGAIVLRGHMLGDALQVHLAVAGAFVFLLLPISWLYLPSSGMADEAAQPADARWWLTRWSVWGLVLSSLVTAGTMFSGMLPVLDTASLLQVTTWHRYAGLTALVFALIHSFSLLCIRLGLR